MIQSVTDIIVTAVDSNQLTSLQIVVTSYTQLSSNI